jgi:6-phosphogluconolactonase
MWGDKVFKMPNIKKFPTRDAAFAALSAAIKDATKNAIANKGFANIALSGGSTPEPAYKDYADADFDWSKVNILLVDERWVDVTDDGSNEKMLQRAFAAAKDVNIIGMKNEVTDLYTAIPIVEAVYNKHLPADAIVLGMGEDAHTASWFAGADNLEDILKPGYPHNIAPINAAHSEVGKKYPLRITLTLPAIASCDMVMLLIFGIKKLEVFERAITGDASSSPVKAAVDAAKKGFVVFWAE